MQTVEREEAEFGGADGAGDVAGDAQGGILKGCMLASSDRFARQFLGVMDGLLRRHRSEKCAYSRRLIFGNGGSTFRGMTGNLSIT